ncbi:hypothetical protein [Streptomyces sp. NPDC053720]|uniref:hypothetical protein n=1 Tax=Streptomyces sp. NPDC053720 TaxID=3154855 RepID=UPI00342274D6
MSGHWRTSDASHTPLTALGAAAALLVGGLLTAVPAARAVGDAPAATPAKAGAGPTAPPSRRPRGA